MSRLTRTLASATVTTALTAALTAGGLAATSAPAQAATAATTYTCTSPIPGLPSFDVPTTFSLPGLPAELPIGVPTGDLPLSSTLALPQGLMTTVFALLGTTLQVTTSNLLVPLGLGEAGVQLQGAVTGLSAGSNGLLLTLGGVVPSFTPEQSGDFSVALPTSFDLTFVNALLVKLGSHCVLKGSTTGSSTIATYSVKKAASSVSARTTKVTKGKKPSVKLTVTVATPGTTTLGSVTASEGGRPLATGALYGGTATFVLKGLTKGVHSLRFAYSGSNFAAPSEQSVSVTFPKAKKKHHGKKHHGKKHRVTNHHR